MVSKQVVVLNNDVSFVSTLGRVLEHVGHRVLRVNHLGDWGTQFGMLIEYMKEKHPDFQNDPPNLTDLTTFYREAKIR